MLEHVGDRLLRAALGGRGSSVAPSQCRLACELRRSCDRASQRQQAGAAREMPGKGCIGMPGSKRDHARRAADHAERLGVVASCVDQGLVGRALDAGLRDQEAGGDRDDQGRDLADQAVADGQEV